jgi:hypothetical protein
MPFPTRVLALAGAVLFIAGAAEAESLTLVMGEARREPAAGAIANVVVVDPTVADVTMIDQHSVIIMGKGFGATEILATDRAGHVLIDDRVVITGPPEEGRVTLYRGAAASNYACMPRCRALDEPSPSAAAAPAAPTVSEHEGPPQPMAVAPPVTVNQTSTPLHP